ERPEGVAAGLARLVGTSPDRIIAAVSALLADGPGEGPAPRPANPFGDGRAAERIAEFITLNQANTSRSVMPAERGWSAARKWTGPDAPRVSLNSLARRSNRLEATA